MIFLVQILRKPQNVSAWHPEKSGHDTLSMYKRACPRLGLSYLTPNGSTRLFQIIIWTIFQNVTSFWCTVLIWPDCPRQPKPILPSHFLDHWRSQFRTFFKRDDTFCPFLSTSFKWDPEKPNFGFSDDPLTDLPEDGSAYQAAEKYEDFTDLLNVLSGSLPNSYLTARITKDTTCWKEVWDLIYQHYERKVTRTTYNTMKDFSNMQDFTLHLLGPRFGLLRTKRKTPWQFQWWIWLHWIGWEKLILIS